jgi:hypothetical protein
MGLAAAATNEGSKVLDRGTTRRDKGQHGRESSMGNAEEILLIIMYYYFIIIICYYYYIIDIIQATKGPEPRESCCVEERNQIQ